MNEEVTHKEIYDRLVAVEAKVDGLTESTKDVTARVGETLTVRYERLVPLLIEAIKELDAELKSMKQLLHGR